MKNPYGAFYAIRNDSLMSWAEADAHCKSLGGALPLPQSQEENDWLAQFGDTHLGLRVGVNDGDLVYTNWRVLEPTGDGPWVFLVTGSR